MQLIIMLPCVAPASTIIRTTFFMLSKTHKLYAQKKFTDLYSKKAHTKMEAQKKRHGSTTT